MQLQAQSRGLISSSRGSRLSVLWGVSQRTWRCGTRWPFHLTALELRPATVHNVKVTRRMQHARTMCRRDDMRHGWFESRGGPPLAPENQKGITPARSAMHSGMCVQLRIHLIRLASAARRARALSSMGVAEGQVRIAVGAAHSVAPARRRDPTS